MYDILNSKIFDLLTLHTKRLSPVFWFSSAQTNYLQRYPCINITNDVHEIKIKELYALIPSKKTLYALMIIQNSHYVKKKRSQNVHCICVDLHYLTLVNCLLLLKHTKPLHELTVYRINSTTTND